MFLHKSLIFLFVKVVLEEPDAAADNVLKCEDDNSLSSDNNNQKQLTLKSVQQNPMHDVCLSGGGGLENVADTAAVSGGINVHGVIGKQPVYLRCELCSVVLPSILAFTSHMRKEHKDSELERNKVGFRATGCPKNDAVFKN